LSEDDRAGDPDPSDAVTVDGPSGRPTGFRVASARPADERKRYEREHEIARGGLGRVVSALDRTLQRRVAIKELHVRTEQGHRRFVREALTTARLQHPAIVPVLDAGAWDTGDPYLVLKHLEGKTLAEELATRKTTEARLALVPSLLAIADALGYAHEHHVVHRDVKPENIMLGTHGETVLLDWGVAYDASASALELEGLGRGPEPEQRWPSARLTQLGAIAGTLRYMSPEQARGEPATPGFDVYCLGATIAEVLSGRPPFADVPPEEILGRLRAGATALPPLPEQIPDDLAAIVAKATAPPPERYPHAGLLAADLRSLIAGQLVTARRYSRVQLVRRWMRRYRLALAILAAAAATIASTAMFAVRSVIRERNAAIVEREQAVTRERQLILAQARASLRTDPTTTIAWLKLYPPDAPDRGEVLALLDEAAGRGVARHVWRAGTAPTDVVVDDGAAFAAYPDGQLVRADVATGTTTVLAQLPSAPAFLRAHGHDVFALDQEGVISRWSRGALTRFAEVAMPSRPSGLFYADALGKLKVTFVDDWAKLVTVEPGNRIEPDPSRLDGLAYSDDESDSAAMYAVLRDGHLAVLDPAPRSLWKFAPHTWVRTSDDGKAYVAIEPASTGVTLWIGSAAGDAPVVLGRSRPCAPGDDQQVLAEVANDGRAVLVLRCGELSAYDARTRRAIPIEAPDRVLYFGLSPTGRWGAIGRANGLDVIDLQTRAIRHLASASAVRLAGFSRDDRWVFSAGAEQGLRVWALDDDVVTTPLGDVWSPTRLSLTSARDEIAVSRHLACATWSPRQSAPITRGQVDAADVRPDDEHMLWAWSSSSDGRTCVFGGRDGSALVVGDRSARLEAREGLEECVLSEDGRTAFCRTPDQVLVTFDIASGSRTAERHVEGSVRGLARYRGTPIALLEHPAGCTLESVGGEILAHLPGGPGCHDLRASNSSQPGHEAGLVVARGRTVDVWNEAGQIAVQATAARVEVSRERGLVAIARDRSIEIRELRAGAPLARPPDHDRSIEHLAWSSRGVLAAADDETVRLWDPDAEHVRVLYVPQVSAIVWSGDGRTLFTSDGHHLAAWPIDLTRGSSPEEIRSRLDDLTSASIVNDRAMTVR
jgi:WD40 repeat protein